MTVATGESAEAIEARYDGGGYGQFKGDVADAVVELLAPIQARYCRAPRRPGRADAAARARRREGARGSAAPTLRAMYERMGFVLSRLARSSRARRGSCAAPRPRRAQLAPRRPAARPVERRAARSCCGGGGRPGWPTAASIRFTWCLRPSWTTSSTRPGPSRRALAGAVRPSSSSTPALERGERGGGRVALDLGDVDLVDLVAGVGEAVGELAVVRQQERAGRVGVEPADRDDAAGMADEPDDGRPAVPGRARS